MRKLMWVIAALFISLTLALPVFAQGGGGKVVLGEAFTLESGETLGGDLAVLGGTATLEKDSLVRGDVAILGGSASIAGRVDGNLVVLGGNVKLRETALIEGQLVNFGAEVTREEGAVIRGGETIGPLEFGFRGPWSTGRGFSTGPRGWFDEGGRMVLNLVWGVIKAIGRAVILTILGLLIVLFLPEHSQRVGDTVIAEPLPSLGVGLLSLVVAFFVGLVLLIAACAGLLIWLAAAIAWIFGWTAVGQIVGQRVLTAFNVQFRRNCQGVESQLHVEPTPPLTTIVGVALISLIWAFPCLGSLFALIVGAIGLGAVVLTRAGTQLYPPAPILPSLPEENLTAVE